MLASLRVEGFALLRDVTLQFRPGFNVLTGETGAGKSLLLDALGLALGARARSEWVASGAPRASVRALFQPDGEARDWGALLAGHGAPWDGEILIHREVTPDGRSRATVNGVPVTASALRAIALELAAVHGQGEQADLARPEEHLDLFDRFVDAPDLVERVRHTCAGLTDAEQELAAFCAQLDSRERRVAELLSVRDAIARVDPRAGEEDALDEEARRLGSADRLRELFEGIVENLGGDDGALAKARRAVRLAGDAGDVHSDFRLLASQAADAVQVLGELERAAQDAAEGAQADPDRLDTVLSRLHAFQELKRRFGPTLPDVLRVAAETASELDALQEPDARRAELEKAAAAARAAYGSAARALSKARRTAAGTFAEEVGRRLKTLAMPAARLALDWSDRSTPHPRGTERLTFLLAPNPGEPPRPLHRTASGGELSRVMLAILLTLHRSGGEGTLVFDEVDAGVAGRTAEALGAALAEAAAGRQVLCVTHLPQVAAVAAHHIAIAKEASGDATSVSARELDGPARVTEVGRMLGGAEASALEHARALLGAAAADAAPKPRPRPKRR